MNDDVRHVVVLGSGSWGTAASALVAANVERVTIVARRPMVADAINELHHNPAHLTDLVLPRNVVATCDIAACEAIDALVVATPSAHLRSTLAATRAHLRSGTPTCLLTKGLDASGKTLASVAARSLGNGCGIAVLSGPNHAEEIAAGMVSAGVIASEDANAAAVFQRLFASVDFRAYTTGDVCGVSLCGATKNVIAIAAGVAVGIGAGDNALAVLMTRGLAEMGRIVSACGGDALTCMGLAGMGDLVATCTSVHSRNRAFGTALVNGTTPGEFEERSGMVVEGAAAAPGIMRLADAHGVEMPVTSAVNAILYGGASVADAVSVLLTRPPNEEFYGFGTQARRDYAT